MSDYIGIVNAIVGGAVVYSFWWLTRLNKKLESHESRISVLESLAEHFNVFAREVKADIRRLEEKMEASSASHARVESTLKAIKEDLDIIKRR